MGRLTRGRGFVLLLLGAGALLAAVPSMVGSYLAFVLSLTFVNIIAVLGLNLLMGYTGQVSIGHAGFVAVGAYVSTLLSIHLGVPFWIALVVGMLAAGLTGAIVGLPALKLNPLYVSIVTFGFGQVVSLVALNWLAVTRGPNGLAVPPVTLGDFSFTSQSFYYPALTIMLLSLWVARNIVESRLGRSMVAVRDSEVAAQAMGVNLASCKTAAFVIGAMYAGLAGGLYAGLSSFINPDSFTFSVSIMYLTMIVVGGMASLLGTILGAAIFTFLPETIQAFADLREFISGALLLIFLVFMPNGLVRLIPSLVNRVRPGGRIAEGGNASTTRGDSLQLEG